MLNFRNVAIRRGARLLFRGAGFTVHAGQRFGITGANGTGKSSLLALVRGELSPDEGEFECPPDVSVAWVAQEMPATDRAAIDYVIDGDEELRQIEQQLAAAERDGDGERLAFLHGRFEAVGGYTASARAARLMHGLGFRPGSEGHPVATFSGGWRMRLNLARALMCRSDLLLLDEPTNHLDLDAVLWLEGWLRGYGGTLLLISHDRDFLDAVVDHVAHIEQEGITVYKGGYSDFERRRAERLAAQQAAFERQQEAVARMRGFVERFRAKATKARQAQSRLKALERMESIAPAHVDSPFRFTFPSPHRVPNPLLTLEDAAAGYGSPVIENVNIGLRPGDRIGLLGPNGAGKSTLVRLLAGELDTLAGHCRRASDLKVGYFAQHQLEQLQPEDGPLRHLQRLDRAAPEQQLRDFLGGFGFGGDMAEREVASMSGGEKARLVLALLVYAGPNLLLLDEPTNHLDLEMRYALELALQQYEGASVIVSHDRHLLRTTTDELWLVDGGAVSRFDGDVDAYREWLVARRRGAPSAEQGKQGTSANSAAGRKDRKRAEAERRQRLQPLRQALARREAEREHSMTQREAIEAELSDPSLYEPQAREQLKILIGRRAELERAVRQAEEAWLEAGEALESAEQNG